MRIRKVRQKVPYETSIPHELVEFFREVDVLIKQQDELVTVPSDDLIQVDDFVSGGLIEEGGNRFSFTYFPGDDDRPRWQLELSAPQIEEIASGKTTALNLWRCQSSDCGNVFATESGTCFYCDYIDDESDHKTTILRGLLQCKTRSEWVEEYLRHFPDAEEMQIIGDYNSYPELGAKWGFFSLREIETLVREFRSQ